MSDFHDIADADSLAPGQARTVEVRGLGQRLPVEQVARLLEADPARFSPGVLLRPLGNTIYVMPPYCISEMELAQIYGEIEIALDELSA